MYQFNIDRFSIMIELWLKVSNVTNHEFVELTGIGLSTLYALKAGQYAPSMAQFTAIINITQFPPETFFKKVKGK